MLVLVIESEIRDQRTEVRGQKSTTSNRSRRESQIWFSLGGTTLHFNIRAVCNEGRDRFCRKRLDEFFAVECGDIGLQFEGIGQPDFPPCMFDEVPLVRSPRAV